MILTAEQLEQLVNDIISRQLDGIKLHDLKKCHDELVATRYALKDMETKERTFKELSRMRGDENERLRAEIVELRLKQDEMKAMQAEQWSEIIKLQSALKGKYPWD